MSYRIASKLTFTPAWEAMSPDERHAERTAAWELVTKFGGAIEHQWVFWSDQEIVSIATFPDVASVCKTEMAINARGAFVLRSQPAVTVDEVLGFQAEIDRS